MFTRSGFSKTIITQAEKMTGKNKPVPNTSTTVSTEGDKLKRSKEDHVESLDELLQRMKAMFDDTNTRIEASVERCKQDLREELNTLRTDVQNIKTECSSEIHRLSDTVVRIGSEVWTNKQRIMVGERRNDLLLSGVPYHATEDLLDYVAGIASALGYDNDSVPLLYAKRLARAPIAAEATPPIVLQFAFKLARDDFFNRYLSSRKLSLIDLGFDVNKRIYLNENLTEEARKIKGKAVKLKKAGKLVSVYTRNGTVYIKANADAAAEPIYSEDQLAV